MLAEPDLAVSESYLVSTAAVAGPRGIRLDQGYQEIAGLTKSNSKWIEWCRVDRLNPARSAAKDDPRCRIAFDAEMRGGGAIVHQ